MRAEEGQDVFALGQLRRAGEQMFEGGQIGPTRL